VSKTAVAADFHQAANVRKDLASKIAFDLIISINNFTKLADLRVRKVLNLRAGVNPSLGNNLGPVLTTDAVKKRNGVQNRLFSRKVYTCNTCHLNHYSINLDVAYAWG